MVKYYDVNESSFKAVFKWNETVFKDIIISPEYWVYLFVLAVFTALLDYDVLSLPEGLEALDIQWIIGPVISVAIFSVVFYQNQCYSRYFTLYQSCCQVDTGVKVLVMELITDFDFAKPLHPLIAQAVKYVVSSCTYFYTNYGGENGMQEECWDIFHFKGLLTEDQLEFVKEYPGDCSGLFLFWAQQVCREMLMSHEAKELYSAPELAAMATRIYSYIDKVYVPFRDVMNLMKMPIPFPYFHMLNTILCFALTLSGFGCLLLSTKAENTYFCSMMPFMLVAYGLLALRRMGGQLSDPFGFDPVDFPTHDFIRHIHDECSALLLVKSRFNATSQASHCVEFTANEVEAPCAVEAFHKGKSVSRSTVVSRLPQDDDEYLVFMHKPRLWTRPEDYSAGFKVANWLEKGFQGLSKSDAEGGRSSLGNGNESLVDVADSQAQDHYYTEEPVDMQMLRALQHMGGKMHELVRAVERNSQALGMQPKKNPLAARKASIKDDLYKKSPEKDLLLKKDVTSDDVIKPKMSPRNSKNIEAEAKTDNDS